MPEDDLLAARLERLLAEDEIRQLSHRYALAVDQGDLVAWRDLWTDDAVMERGYRPPAQLEDIVQIPEIQLRRYAKTWHGIQTQNIRLMDETSAEGDVYCIARHVYTDSHNQPGSLPFSLVHDVLIRYADQYRKTDDGRWRFASRNLTIDLREVRQVTLVDHEVDLSEITPRIF